MAFDFFDDVRMWGVQDKGVYEIESRPSQATERNGQIYVRLINKDKDRLARCYCYAHEDVEAAKLALLNWYLEQRDATR